MADFCQQCSIDMFGKDFRELARNAMKAQLVTVIDFLESGYVRLSGKSPMAWAQMPTIEWMNLESGAIVPEKYTFQPEWNLLRKQ